MIQSILAKPVFMAPALVLALAAMSLPGWAQDVVEGADDPGYSEPGEGIDGELLPSDDQLIWIDDPNFVPGDDVIWIEDPGFEPGDGDMTDDWTDDGADDGTTGEDDIIWLDDPALYDEPIALDGSDCGGCEYQTTGGITPAEIRTGSGSGSGASGGAAPASGGGDMCQILPWKNMWICEIQAGAALQ